MNFQPKYTEIYLVQTRYLDVLRTETATGKSQVRGFDKEGRAIYLMRPRLKLEM